MPGRTLIGLFCVLVVLVELPAVARDHHGSVPVSAELNEQADSVENVVLTELGTGSEGSAVEHGGDAAPNIFSGDLAMAFWTILLFVILLAVLGKWAWGPILTGLQKREEHIRLSIEDAEKARSDADKALAQYQQQLSEAQGQAQAIIEKGRTDALQLAEQLKQQAQDEAQELRHRAQHDIVSARDQALQEIYDQSAQLATDLAGRIINKNLDPQDHRRLLQESLTQLRSDSNQD